MTIKNLPESAREYTFIVYRNVDGQNWYFTACDDERDAWATAMDLGLCGNVIRSEYVD